MEGIKARDLRKKDPQESRRMMPEHSNACSVPLKRPCLHFCIAYYLKLSQRDVHSEIFVSVQEGYRIKILPQ